MAFRTNKVPVLQTKSASGSVATFNTALAMPLASCKVNIPVTQEGTGDPSPDNVRDFVGIDSLDFIATGGNIWDETTKLGYYRPSSGRYIDVSDQLCSATLIAVQPNTTYRFVKPNTHGDVLFYDENGVYLNQYVRNVQKNGTFTTPSGCYKININLGNDYGATYNDDVIIAYSAGTYITFSFGSTIYAGELDVLTGILTATHGYIASYNGETLNEPWLSSMDVYAEGTTPTIGAEVVYPLTTPEVINLGEMDIETLQGENNLFASTGDIDLTYKDLDIAKRGNFREVFRLPS